MRKKEKYTGEPIKEKNDKLKSRRTLKEKIEDMERAKVFLSECKKSEKQQRHKLQRIEIKSLGAVVHTTDPEKYIRQYGESNVII